MGKLRIYPSAGEIVTGDKFIHKVFPQYKFRKMLDEAKKSRVLNAHIFHTHAA